MTLLKYRQHESSICHTDKARQNEAIRRTIEAARIRRGLTDGAVATPPDLRLDQGPIHGKWGWWALSAGNVTSARKHALTCLGKAPLSIESLRLLCCAIRGR